MNDCNEWIHSSCWHHHRGADGAAGVNATNVLRLDADGKLFKKLVGKTDDSQSRYSCWQAPVALRTTGNDIITVTQKTKCWNCWRQLML